MSEGLDSYLGLKGLVETTESNAKAILPTSMFQAFLNQLKVRGVAPPRLSRLELSELIGRTITFNPGLFSPGVWPSGLRSELKGEFEKFGLSSSDAWDVADLFLEMAKEGELK